MTTSSKNYGHFWKGSEILRNFQKLLKSFETVFVLKQFLKIFGNLWIIFRIFWKISEMVQNGIRNFKSFWKTSLGSSSKLVFGSFYEFLNIQKSSEVFGNLQKEFKQ